MAVFTYEAVRRDGSSDQVTRGKITAADPTAARAMLRAKGQVASQLQETVTKPGRDFSKVNIRLRPNHIATKDLAWMSHKLAAAASTGVSIPRTLDVMAKQRPKSPIAPILTDIALRVQRGQGMGAAFGAYSKQLGATTSSLVKAGEISGTMDVALVRLGEMHDDRRELQQTVRSAIVYPLLSLFFSLAIAAFLLIVIVPKFKDFFDQLHGKLPALTQFMVNLSDLLRGHLLLLPFLSIALIAGVIYGRRIPQVARFVDGLVIRLPVVGPVFEGAVLARISGTMATLLGAGLGIQETLDLSGEVANNQIHKEIMIAVRNDMIRDGMSLSFALNQRGGTRMAEMALAAQTGEENGQLVESLGRYARDTAQYVRTMTKGLSASLEPILIMVVGGVVGTIVVAFYLPEFALIKAIKPG